MDVRLDSAILFAMEAFQYIVMLLVGIGLGAITVWLILRGRISNAFEQGRGESRTEMATLSERIIGREASIEELKNQLLERNTSLRDLQLQITNLSTRGATRNGLARNNTRVGKNSSYWKMPSINLKKHSRP